LNNRLWGVEFNEVTFCKVNDGMTTLGSRGIINSNGWVRSVCIETSFPFRSRIVNEIDLDRFVFDWDDDWSAEASGCIID
jgi:hypothetical protein